MAVSPERLQAVAWWNLQIVEACGGIKNGEFAQGELAEGHASDAPKAPHRLSRKQGLGVSATKRPDHTATLPPPGVGTPSGGSGRRRSRADMAAWLACVPPLTSATPVTLQRGCAHATERMKRMGETRRSVAIERQRTRSPRKRSAAPKASPHRPRLAISSSIEQPSCVATSLRICRKVPTFTGLWAGIVRCGCLFVGSANSHGAGGAQPGTGR